MEPALSAVAGHRCLAIATVPFAPSRASCWCSTSIEYLRPSDVVRR